MTDRDGIHGEPGRVHAASTKDDIISMLLSHPERPVLPSGDRVLLFVNSMGAPCRSNFTLPTARRTTPATRFLQSSSSLVILYLSLEMATGPGYALKMDDGTLDLWTPRYARRVLGICYHHHQTGYLNDPGFCCGDAENREYLIGFDAAIDADHGANMDRI
jgi:hypothetical protein